MNDKSAAGSKSINRKLTLLGLPGAIIVLGLVIWQAVGMITRFNSSNNQVQLVKPQPDWSSPTVWRVSVKDAWNAVKAGDAIVVDTRDVEAYQILHIKGAVNIPATDMATRYTELDPDKWIITYCT